LPQPEKASRSFRKLYRMQKYVTIIRERRGNRGAADQKNFNTKTSIADITVLQETHPGP
jgi:hypothetical protein